MKIFKMLLQISAIAALTFGCFTTSYAHPGRTDSNGGHYNRSTGEYHYHHGYPEHQHPNGVCPYDFDDKTGDSSGTSSYRSNTSSSYRSNTSRTTTNRTVSPKPSTDTSLLENLENENASLRKDLENLQKNYSNLTDENFRLMLGIVGITLISIFLAFKMKRHISALEKENKELTSKVAQLQESSLLDDIKKLEQDKKYLESQNQSLDMRVIRLEERMESQNNYLRGHISKQKKKLSTQTTQYNILTKNLYLSPDKRLLTQEECLKEAGVPKGVTFDKDLLPHYFVNPTVERNFYVYISKGGTHYHRTPMCSGAWMRVHLFSVCNKYTPCERCVPYKARNYRIPAWYYKYISLMKEHIFTSDKPPEDILDLAETSLDDNKEGSA